MGNDPLPSFPLPLEELNRNYSVAPENIGSHVFLMDATTDELVDALTDRGYLVTLQKKPAR